MNKKFNNIDELMKDVRNNLIKFGYCFNEVVILDNPEGIISIGNFFQFEKYLLKNGISFKNGYTITAKIEKDEYGVIVSFYSYCTISGNNVNFLHSFYPMEINYKK